MRALPDDLALEGEARAEGGSAGVPGERRAPSPLLQALRGELTIAQWVTDLVAAAALGLLGLLPLGWGFEPPSPLVLISAVLSLAVRRRSPPAALALAWLTAVLQMALIESPSIVEVAALVVVATTAARGTRSAMWAAGASAVVGGLLAPIYLFLVGSRFISLLVEVPLIPRVAFAAAPLALLGAAWLAGVAVRATVSRRSETGRRVVAETVAVQAQSVAEVERARTTMAREVHDVVGHSLAVIIAQADAAALVIEPGRGRDMIATIAATARTSLDEVRAVLDRTGAAPQAGTQTLDEVVEQVRSTGIPLHDEVEGAERPLPPAVGLVARRVLQEMLTNALRHGEPGADIDVRRSWRPSALVLQVGNRISAQPTSGSGAGLPGMRERLDRIGGTLEADAVDGRFLARARIPLDGQPEA